MKKESRENIKNIKPLSFLLKYLDKIKNEKKNRKGVAYSPEDEKKIISLFNLSLYQISEIICKENRILLSKEYNYIDYTSKVFYWSIFNKDKKNEKDEIKYSLAKIIFNLTERIDEKYYLIESKEIEKKFFSLYINPSFKIYTSLDTYLNLGTLYLFLNSIFTSF